MKQAESPPNSAEAVGGDELKIGMRKTMQCVVVGDGTWLVILVPLFAVILTLIWNTP